MRGLPARSTRLRSAGKKAHITVRLSERRLHQDVAYDTGFFRLTVRDGKGGEESSMAA